jgi:hypothetical protein
MFEPDAKKKGFDRLTYVVQQAQRWEVEDEVSTATLLDDG